MLLNLKTWQKVLFLLGISLFMFSTTGRAEVVERILAVVNDGVSPNPKWTRWPRPCRASRG